MEGGLGQCVAQMVAAREFNAADRGPAPVHGCVTTGEAWQFLRLAGDAVELDRRRFYLDNVPGVLAAIAAVVRTAEEQCKPQGAGLVDGGIRRLIVGEERLVAAVPLTTP